MKNLTRIAALLIMAFLLTNIQAQNKTEHPLRLAVAGMTHDHIGFILNRNKSDIKIEGIYEKNHEMAERYAKKYHFDPSLVFDNLGEMLDKVKPEAVVAFGPIYDHLEVVEACAPRGIHVMVEKPLATNMEQAEKMQDLAGKFHIYLLTDYETSWYPSTAKSWQLVNDSSFVGNIRKVVVHDGHQGPKEIGCSKEFLQWLTDPVLNGGGAIIDFGCYGANLMTYLTKGIEPVSVTAITSHYKPDIYPKVDDDATIMVSYPGSLCIIQASWDWPFGRKDMEIYGDKGYIIAENNKDMRIRNNQNGNEIRKKISAESVRVYEDPFSYFIDVIRGKLKITAYDPYSLPNNIMVVRILDAARKSAKSGKTVSLSK